jgi:hypothetical protein
MKRKNIGPSSLANLNLAGPWLSCTAWGGSPEKQPITARGWSYRSKRVDKIEEGVRFPVEQSRRFG